MKIIAYVEDEVGLLQVVATFFEKRNFEVRQFTDGQLFLDEYDKQRDEIDVILLDILMPKASGITVMEELIEKENDIPVIVLSNTVDHNPSEALGDGMSDFISAGLVEVFEKSNISLAELERVVKKYV